MVMVACGDCGGGEIMVAVKPNTLINILHIVRHQCNLYLKHIVAVLMKYAKILPVSNLHHREQHTFTLSYGVTYAS